MTQKDPTSSTNDGFCLQMSSNSSLSCESDLSSFSFDKEVADTYTNRMHSDELPAFEIRLISPLGRSPSPIDSDLDFPSSPTHSCITPTRSTSRKQQAAYKDNEDFVPLHDINAQISPPSDSESNPLSEGSRANSLETIFEGVFLNTPPRQGQQRKSGSRSNSRSNLMEKIAINRLNFAAAAGKENAQEKGGGSQARSDTTTDD